VSVCGVVSQDEGVRKNTLMVLTHLILNDMVKVKGQIGEIAVCLEDSDARIRDLTRMFFHELSKRGATCRHVARVRRMFCVCVTHIPAHVASLVCVAARYRSASPQRDCDPLSLLRAVQATTPSTTCCPTPSARCRSIRRCRSRSSAPSCDSC
jgi:hypothetical protein